MNLLSLKTIPKAIFDALDLLMRSNAAVYSGIAPTAHGIASLQVDVASGTYFKAGSFTSVTYAGGNVILGAGDPNNPRYDIIYLDNTNTLRVGAGTPASQNPVAPAWPANSCPIATAFVPANAVDLLNSGATNSGFIQDMRQFWPSHAATHNIGGTDALAQANATTAGLVPTPPNNTTTYFRGDATFQTLSTSLPYATPAIALGTAAAAGAAASVIRSDSTIVAFDATLPAAETSGAAGTVGVATVASRRDHIHPMPTFPAAVDVQLFTTTGTWNKPSGTPKWVEVIAFGGGGGGGAAANNANSSGSGGGAGATIRRGFDPSALGVTEAVTVGTAGNGGVKGAPPTAATAGGNSSFGSHFTAYGGGPGIGGLNTASGGSGGGATSAGVIGVNSAANIGGGPHAYSTAVAGTVAGEEGAGGNNSLAGGCADSGGAAGGGIANIVNGKDGGSALRSAGGGGGGGNTNAASVAGGNGGVFGSYTAGGAANGGAAGNNAGTAGTSRSGTGKAGDGGGGGGASSVSGGNGGAGGVPGGGGGGGGAGSGTPANNGNGGAGGRGEVIVVTFF